jgi:hypothetical protein
MPEPVVAPPVPATPPTPAAPAATAPPVAPAPRKPPPIVDVVQRERAVQADKAAWKAERARQDADFAAKTKGLDERLKRAEAVEARIAAAKKAPLDALAALDLTYDELAQAQLNKGKPGADLAARRAEEEIAALRKEIADDKAKQKADAEAAEKAAEKQTVAQWHAQTTRQVQQAGAEFELINALGYAREVGKMIEEHFDATGKEVGWKFAAAELEKHLQSGKVPEVAQTIKNFTETKWFKSRFRPIDAAEPEVKPAAPPRRTADKSPLEVTETPDQIRRQAAPTITNRMTPSVSSKVKTAAGKSRDELRAQAIAALNA